MPPSYAVPRLYRNEPGNPPLKGSKLVRGDSLFLKLMIFEPGQEEATFRFVAKPEAEHPDGMAIIDKKPEDFTIIIEDKLLQAEFEILPIETRFLTEKITLIYDLERTIPVVDGSPKVKTIEQAKFTIVLDVATRGKHK